jgi:hypothetical protein
MQDCFRIAVCLVNVPLCLQLFAKISVVVDLTVVNDMKSFVLIRHWLMAGRYIDDTQTPVTQPHSTINEDAFVVRSTMGDDVAHALEHGSIYDPP